MNKDREARAKALANVELTNSHTYTHTHTHTTSLFPSLSILHPTLLHLDLFCALCFPSFLLPNPTVSMKLSVPHGQPVPSQQAHTHGLPLPPRAPALRNIKGFMMQTGDPTGKDCAKATASQLSQQRRTVPMPSPRPRSTLALTPPPGRAPFPHRQGQGRKQHLGRPL